MRRLILNLAPVLFLLSIAYPAQAQQAKKVPRIGFLGNGSPASEAGRIEALRQGLKELGYIEGKNIAFEFRYGEGNSQRASELTAELVRFPVDVIVVGGGTSLALMVKKAAPSIPIVFTNVSNAVGSGLVASLARPGGNATGLSSVSRDLGGKRLELLKEIVPRISRVAVLWNPATRSEALKEVRAVASSLQMELKIMEVRNAGDLEKAFQRATRDRAEALSVLPDPGVFSSSRDRIVELALKNRLPSMYPNQDWVQAGGLVSYGTNYADLSRRAAIYVDKILKGAKPADLPVEQPTKFEFVINLKTAKQIGVTIPQSVLYRADKVIK